jgi:RNA recognition motif-containing protein
MSAGLLWWGGGSFPRGHCFEAKVVNRQRREKRHTTVKLFIGGLSWSTSEDSLRAAFAEFGDVTEAIVVLDRETGRSRGFGFVTYSSDSSAQEAIERMNGSTLEGRTLVVNEAREREPRGTGRPAMGRRY